MRQEEFEKEWKERLQENRQLVEHQYLPRKMFGTAAFVGRNLFWVMLFASGMLAVVTMTRFAEQIKWVNAVLLFL